MGRMKGQLHGQMKERNGEISLPEWNKSFAYDNLKEKSVYIHMYIYTYTCIYLSTHSIHTYRS